MSAEQGETPRQDLYRVITDRLDQATQQALDAEPDDSPLRVVAEGFSEVVELKQAANPNLLIVLARPTLAMEALQNKVSAAIGYAITPSLYGIVDYPEITPDVELISTVRHFMAFDESVVIEILEFGESWYGRNLGEGEQADIVSLVDQAT